MSGASQGPLVGGPAQAFATGQLQTVVATLQNLVVQIGTLTKQISDSTSAIFPQTAGTATTATGGAGTLPAAPVGFIEVKLPSGATALVPYYNP